MYTVIPRLMFAEVSDKIPSVPELWALGIVCAAIAFCICRYFKPALVVCVPLALLWVIGVCKELFGDEYFKAAVVGEMGYGYLLQVVVTNSLPLLALLAGFCVHWNWHRMPHQGRDSAA